LFHQNRNKLIRFCLPLTLTLAAYVLRAANLQAQSGGDAGKIIIMAGRVLADVDHLTGFLKGSFGDRYQVFVFGTESKEKQRDHLALVKVMYEFYKSDPSLTDSFFDYSNRYELQLVRESSCDETVQSLSYEKNVDETGKPLPSTYVLRLLDGVPKHVLKPDALLPCYVLRPGKYRVLSAGKKSKLDSKTSESGSSPTPTTR
jgi:hypothetical protein